MSGVVLSPGQPSQFTGDAGLAGAVGETDGTGAGWLAVDGTTGTLTTGVADVPPVVGNCVGADEVSPEGRLVGRVVGRRLLGDEL